MSASRAATPRASRRARSSWTRLSFSPRSGSRRFGRPRATCRLSCWQPCGSTGNKDRDAGRSPGGRRSWPARNGAALAYRAGEHEAAAGDGGQLLGDQASFVLVLRLQSHDRASHEGSTTCAMAYCISTLWRLGLPRGAEQRVSIGRGDHRRLTPVWVRPEAAAFARAVVAKVGPESRERAKALLHASSRLAAFGCSIGLAMDPDVLFEPSLIERFVLGSTSALSPSSRRTVRSNLRFFARRVPSVVPAGPVALPRAMPRPPTAPLEIDAYLALAKAQPTVSKNMPLTGLICLGAGAGLVGKDLRFVRGRRRRLSIWRPCRHRLWRRPRVVPVLTRYHGSWRLRPPFPDRAT